MKKDFHQNYYLKFIMLFGLFLVFSCHEEEVPCCQDLPTGNDVAFCPQTTHPQACDSLQLLYQANPQSFQNTNWFKEEKNLCLWSGVTCNASNQITNLNLASRNVKILPDSSFVGLPHIQQLLLDHNQLTQIQANTFATLAELQELYLGDNQIKELQENTFTGLVNLQGLYLDHNQILKIQNLSFAKLIHLKRLVLSFNQIEELQTNTFVGLAQLEYFEIYDNQINSLQDNTFSFLTHLQELNIGNNRMTKLAANTFGGLVNLQTLNLSNNQLANVETEVFYTCMGMPATCISKLSLLKTLYVSNNPNLSSLPKLLCEDKNITLLYRNTKVINCR